jgi:hypothetical protein
MTNEINNKVSLAVFDVALGTIDKEYRESSINLSPNGRGPEVAQVKHGGMLYASD